MPCYLSLKNFKMSSHRVYFSYLGLSEREYFDEFDKYNTCNSWFVMIYILRSMVPFCLGLLIGSFDLPEFLDQIIQEKKIAIESFSNNMTLTSISNIFHETCPETQKPHHVGRMENVTQTANICDREDLATEMAVYKNLGFSIGAIIGGTSADLFGRRPVIFSFSIFWTILAFVLAFAPSLIVLQVLFIMNVTCATAVNVVSFINFCEISHRKNRFLVVFTFQSYMIARFLLMIIINQIPIWRDMLIFISTTVLFTIFGAWYTPESPRWLLNKYKKEKAYHLLREISGLKYEEFVMVPSEEDNDIIEKNKLKLWCSMMQHLFSKRFKHTFLCGLMMVCSVMFYSCARMKTVINFIHTKEMGYLACTIEIVSSLMFVAFYMFMGKRISLVVSYILLSTVALIALLTYDEGEEIYYNIFAILFGFTTVLLLWLYIIDIFPTFVRGTAFGYGFCVFGLSAIAGIFLVRGVKLFTEFNYYLTFFLIGLLGSCVLFLPVTTKQDLPNAKLYS